MDQHNLGYVTSPFKAYHLSTEIKEAEALQSLNEITNVHHLNLLVYDPEQTFYSTVIHVITTKVQNFQRK